MQMRKVRAVRDRSALYVVTHARRQHGRGKGPSEPYEGESNPRKALENALKDLPFKLRPPCFAPKKPIPVPKLVTAKDKMVILVWGYWQKSPATLYGNSHFGRGNFRIKVCRDPKHELKSLGKRGFIYNFS